jgi:uncharacterized protein YbjT (DUF2867 family)
VTTDSSILVIGATGKQGGATARALLAAGTKVRAFVRDPESDRARALAELGATLVRGDLDDPESVKAAATGVRGIFSVQTPDVNDLMGDMEVRHGRAIVEAGRAAGVEQIVHTSVSGTGTIDPDTIDEQRWGSYLPHYFRSKSAVERMAREAGFRHWTILRPATFMENFVRPSVYFADFTSDRLLLAVDADASFSAVAVDDVGVAAAAAFADPARFHQVTLELAGEVLTYRAAAEILSAVLGTTITPPSGPEQARAEGLHPAWAISQEFMQKHPAPARPDDAHALGLPTTTFRQWASRTFGAGR